MVGTSGDRKNHHYFKIPNKKQQKSMSDRKQQVGKKTAGKQQVILNSNTATIIIPFKY